MDKNSHEPDRSLVPSTKRRRSGERHRAILAAATGVVAEKGYSAATIEAVASRAGVGKMTIYRWWSSKADLYTELYGVLVPADKLVTDRGGLVQDMHFIFSTLFKIYRKTVAPVVLAGLISESQHNEEARQNLDGGIVIARRNLLTAPLMRAQERGEISNDTDIEFLTDLIVGAIWHRILTRPKRLNKKFVESLCRMAMIQGNSS